MTTYITRDSCNELLVKHGDGADGFHKFANAAIQAYRDSLVAGVVLPEPDAADGMGGWFREHTVRQAVADALAKQVQLENVNCDTCRYHHKEADQTPCNTCIHIRDFKSNFEPRTDAKT